MKKPITRIAVILIIAAVAVAVWYFGYHNRKNPDNIPSTQIMLEYITTEGEEYAADTLKGYSREVIQEVWGEPYAILEAGASEMWKADDNDAYILITYNEKDKAESVYWASVFTAVVKEADDNSILVEPDADSWVSRSSGEFHVGLTALEGSKELQVGDKVEIIFSGGIQESDPAGLDRVHRIRIIE